MKSKFLFVVSLLFLFVVCLQVTTYSQTYVLLGWNDLGMHCANKDFSKIAILPPFNNIYAQLIKNTPGQIPQIINSGVVIEYSIPGNTFSVGKTNFWTYAQDLFGLTDPLPDNIGLTGKSLTGNLDPQGNYYFARGIPVTPFKDADLLHEDPFQLIHLVARDSITLNVLATTDVVIPVSNEIGCIQSGCHVSEQSILDEHHLKPDDFKPTGPNLCASCHGDNALGTTGDMGTPPLSYAIHYRHAMLKLPNTLETCYKCHPGPTTNCLRDVMSQRGFNTKCQDCHGTLDNMALSIKNGRQPWLNEPQCGSSQCHGSRFAEEPGKLFRESQGHGGLFCEACHTSTHAILPSREANDNLQNLRLQGYVGTLKKCDVCHGDNIVSGGPHGIPAYIPPPLPSIANPLYLQPVADPMAIPKFVNPLPVINQLGLRVNAIDETNFTVRMEPAEQDLLGGGLGYMTTVWGYGVNNNPVSYPGPTFVAKKNVPVQITYLNNLGYSHPMPVDTSVYWAFSMSPQVGHTIAELGVPAVVHLHGGHTDSDYDGLPLSWFTPSYHSNPTSSLYKGSTFASNIYSYDNSQEAATLWYHDHVMGLTRLNVYMGLAGFYLLRDDNELNLIAQNKIPSGDYEIEMVIQDRMFYPDGQLARPNTPSLPGLLPEQTIQPEFFGDVILVNGKVWPYLNVEPRKYRFRILNGADSRFFHLNFSNSLLLFKIIGSDDGFLPSIVTQKDLLIAPGERYDVVVDFSNSALLGQSITLKNDAAAPYPDGDADSFNPMTNGMIMQFRVGTTPVSDPVLLPASLRPPISRLSSTVPSRKLLLWETTDAYGRIMPVLGTAAGGMKLDMEPVTETPLLNSTEIWEIYNTTGDVHPMHLHLVSFQTINRQAFTAVQDPNTGALTNIRFTAAPVPPKPYELGWKDTKVMYPGEVTRIIAKFDKPGYYVWHCHILSHEDNDMMRPFRVVTSLPKEYALQQDILPLEFSLGQNYPNPFNPVTTINFSIPENTHVTLKVYDILGKEIATLINQDLFAGMHTVRLDASNLPSGVYVYKILAGKNSEVKKLMLMK